MTSYTQPLRAPFLSSLLGIALAGTLLTNTALAQSTTKVVEERWYKVELIVFKSEEANAPYQEKWPPYPALAYPSQFRFVVDPNEVAHRELEFSTGQSEVDPFGRQIVTIGTPPYLEPAVELEDNNPMIEPDPNSVPLNGEETEPELPPLLKPEAFISLPEEQLEFLERVQAMAANERYQVLLHQGWVQPVANKQDTLPIILDRSGDTQQWPVLQGSITLYLARYLHLETNLWLNTMAEYFPDSWIPEPPPLGPSSLILQDYTETADLPELIEAPVSSPIDVENEEAEEQAVTLEPAGPVYPWRHAVQLKQKRRMRSTEVHYIDHPMMGLVILLTPLDEEELDAMARGPGPEDPNQVE